VLLEAFLLNFRLFCCYLTRKSIEELLERENIEWEEVKESEETEEEEKRKNKRKIGKMEKKGGIYWMEIVGKKGGEW